MRVKSFGPVALHILVGAAVLVFGARTRCGEDECLRTLFLVVAAVMWSVALPIVLHLARSIRVDSYMLSWLLAVVWAPLTGPVTLALFVLAPSLGGA